MRHIAKIYLFLLLSVGLLVQAEENIHPFDSPVNPESYLIRPGDKLMITFINSQVKSLTLEIDPEGKIVHETIGLINLQNRTLAFAKTKLVEILKKLYNVKSIEISITAPRQVSIAVYGAVLNPGVYRGMTSDRVSDIIKKAGGISQNGSSRNIIFKSGQREIVVDLDKAKYQGDISLNPHLYAGEVIEVPGKSSQTVQVIGDVRLSREIELKEGDNISTLIQLAGNYKNSAEYSDVHILRGNKTIKNGTIQAGDIIVVKKKTSHKNISIKLFGAVQNQGLYAYTKGVTLDDLLSQAGGYSEKANKEMTTVFRQPLVDSHGEVSEIRFPISIPLQTTEESVLILEINDSIFVPWKVGFVKISGAVLNPGYFPYQNNKDLLYYIKSAGGFLPTSNKDEIQIFNPISETTISVTSGVLVPDGAEIIVQVKEELK